MSEWNVNNKESTSTRSPITITTPFILIAHLESISLTYTRFKYIYNINTSLNINLTNFNLGDRPLNQLN